MAKLNQVIKMEDNDIKDISDIVIDWDKTDAMLKKELKKYDTLIPFNRSILDAQMIY